MVKQYYIERIALGTRCHHSGHEVHPEASYLSSENKLLPIVYKKNKNNNPKLSQFEAAFGTLARLFLGDNLAPNSRVVRNKRHQVVGVASDHLSHTIAHREGLDKTFYRIERADSFRTCVASVNEEKQIPFYFFNQFPPGFFSTLLQEHHANRLRLNMESLVSVLTTSYTLEEDDLHKGNFGFYLVEKEGMPEAVFFKIDHDLMLADSVMSRCQSRFLNWFLGSDAFKVTARDLLDFPKLTDSQNYYWPTRERLFHFNTNHAYTNAHERQSFAELGRIPEFKRLKWQMFLKHSLMPAELVREQLSQDFERGNASDRANLAMITQSVIARQAKLRAVLFSIPEFRLFVAKMNSHEFKTLTENMVKDISNHEMRDEMLLNIEHTLAHYQELCRSPHGFDAEDTPLHAAIRLGDYRYHETWQVFSSFAQVTNRKGQSALDVALAKAHESKQAPGDDLRCNFSAIAAHLQQETGKRLPTEKASKRQTKTDFFEHLSYLKRASETDDYDAFKQLLQTIGEDHRYGLKTQKEIASRCLSRWIEEKKTHPEFKAHLNRLKADLNGTSTTPPAPELQYIRQLRSQLWIVRIIRGLFGGTATKVLFNQSINQALNALRQTNAPSSAFFAHKKQSNGDSKGVADEDDTLSNPMLSR